MIKTTEKDYEIGEKKIDSTDYDACLVYYAQEGVCMWCRGEKTVTYNAGTDDESTSVCSVCVPDEDPDSWKDNEEDR